MSHLVRHLYHCYKRPIHPRAMFFLIVCSIIGIPCFATEKLPGYCDADIYRTRLKDESGYQPYNDRCEGAYEPNVSLGSAAPVELIGFTRKPFTFDAQTQDSLEFQWSRSFSKATVIRLESMVESGQSFRMDTLLPATSEYYHWSTEVAGAFSLSSEDIASLAWQRLSIGGVTENVHIPLMLNAQAQSGNDYALQFHLAQRFTSIQVLLHELPPDKNPIELLHLTLPAKKLPKNAPATLQLAVEFPSSSNITIIQLTVIATTVPIPGRGQPRAIRRYLAVGKISDV